MSALRWFGSQWLAGSESIAKLTVDAVVLIATAILSVVVLIAAAIGAFVVVVKATWPFLLLAAGFAVAIYGIISMA